MLLYGEKIYLRPFSRDDLPVFQAWTNDPEYLSDYNFFGLHNENALEKDFQEDGFLGARHGRLVVVTREKQIAGDVSYRQVRYGPNEGSVSCEIGIVLAPEHRGKGYGVEAQRLLCDYLFAIFPIMRIQAATDITNLAEQRALEKVGFVREGVLRKAQWRTGKWHDICIYSKLRGE